MVAVLIATVAFVAAYSVPSGNKESNGLPVLGSHPLNALYWNSWEVKGGPLFPKVSGNIDEEACSFHAFGDFACVNFCEKVVCDLSKWLGVALNCLLLVWEN